MAGNAGGGIPRDPQQAMSAYGPPGTPPGKQFDAYVPITAEVVRHGDPNDVDEYEPRPRAILFPAMLFLATCYCTYLVNGVAYAIAVMFILTAHELGHFFQAVRYRIPASLPMFIPMPFSPLGTMGAVIGMAPGQGDRKALFDVAVSGPIAGLIPSLICCVWGLQLSEVVHLQVAPGAAAPLMLGEPLVFKFISHFIFGPLPVGMDIQLHPIAFAGWVGLLITALNLFPIGQLDGGHTLYALLGRRAHFIARLTWAGCLAAMVVSGNWGWSIMLLLVWMMGTDHPPTANDSVPLGGLRKFIGWALLLFVPFGFTPTPFVFDQPEEVRKPAEAPQIVEHWELPRLEKLGPDYERRRLQESSAAADNNLSDHRPYAQERQQTN